MAAAAVVEHDDGAPAPEHDGPVLRVRGREIPVVLPRLTDPRLSLALAITSVQVLGQTVLDFDLSIAQILLSVGTCALLEVLIGLVDRGELAWPASAMQTGNSIALILRAPGTEHGDWWSTRGWALFVGVAAFSILSKHAVRWGGRHLFNPANLGLVVAFVALGSDWADPQDLWWGPLGPPVAAVLVVIALGCVLATRRARVLSVAVAFYVPFAAAVAVLAASGHSITARWSVGPVSNWHYWVVVVTSPEILIFALFMITDPRTVPRGATARVVFGATVAVVAALLIAPQDTEFATKVGILAALVLVCALRPLLERRLPEGTAAVTELAGRAVRSPRILAPVVGGSLLVAAAVVLAGGPARDTASAGTGAVEVGAGGERPAVTVETVPVTVGSVDGVAGTVDPDTARRVADDVLAGLAIEAEAIRTGDAALAATAVYGERLAQVEAALAGGTPIPVAPGPPERATVLLVRGTSSPQAPPQLAVTLVGPGDRARTFLVVESAAAYLIEAEVDPIR